MSGTMETGMAIMNPERTVQVKEKAEATMKTENLDSLREDLDFIQEKKEIAMDSVPTGTEDIVSLKNVVLFYMKNHHTAITKRTVVNK